jgi:steroid 5-alpha reductase family enzyme
MNQTERSSLLAIPVALAAAALVAWAGSRGGQIIAGLPVYAWCVAVAFVIQWIAFVPAYLSQSERFYDLTGTVTYITVTALALILSRPLDLRSALLGALVLIWTVRLGTYLFRRVVASGKDARFDEIKTSLPRFLMTWTLQGLWVSLTLAAALAVITTHTRVALGPIGWIGLAVWIVGFGVEAIADDQKRRFRSDPENRGRFISTGLWSWSRHPNYFGEIVLWIGVAVISVPALSGWQWATLISPVFVTLLITRVSGVPMLEERADERWGGQEDYEAYKRRTPVLLPWPPRR